MAVIGLLLVLAVAIGGAELLVSNTGSYDLELFGRTVENVPLGGIFLAGALGMLALLFGLMMLTSGVGAARRRRTERTAELKRHKQSATALQEALAETADENDRLRRAMAEERLAQDTLGGVAVPPQVVNTEAARMAAEDSPRFLRGRHRART
jgi:hypothetical protein